MVQTRTYTSRPPASARVARDAWDYFKSKHLGGKREITELFYSPNIDWSFRGWVCVFEIRNNDLDHWNFSVENVTHTAPSHAIQAWAQERRG